jgi:hypothetical protein
MITDRYGHAYPYILVHPSVALLCLALTSQHSRRSPSRSRSPGRRHRHRSYSRSRSRSRDRSHRDRRAKFSPPPLHAHRRMGHGREREGGEKSVGGPMNAPAAEAEAHAKVSQRENRLYVGNLPYDCNYKDLEKFMSGGGFGLDFLSGSLGSWDIGITKS